jgi:GMP synthase-like glutamine amidotransferase
VPSAIRQPFERLSRHAEGLLRVRMNKICVLDFGAQYSQLIARRICEMCVYSEIVPCTEPLETILAQGYRGIVLSGGPSSVYDEGAPLPTAGYSRRAFPCSDTR